MGNACSRRGAQRPPADGNQDGVWASVWASPFCRLCRLFACCLQPEVPTNPARARVDVPAAPAVDPMEAEPAAAPIIQGAGPMGDGPKVVKGRKLSKEPVPMSDSEVVRNNKESQSKRGWKSSNN